MIKIIEDLFQMPRNINELDKALEYIDKIIPLQIYSFLEGKKYCSWIIPKGGIRVGEHTLKGTTKEEIIIPIHLCHDKMANDNLSGVAVAIRLAQWIKNHKYTYRFLFLPETIGTIAYLSTYQRDYKFGIVIDSVGGDGELVTTLPKTPSLLPYYVSGKTNLFFSDEHLWSGNDERTLEGFDISSIQISRSPFLEYHTNHDTSDRIDEKQLQSTLEYVKSIIDKIEKDFVPTPNFAGIPCLSATGLWKKEYGSPHTFMKIERIYHSLRYELSIAQIAKMHGLPFDFVYQFVNQLKEKKLC